MRAAAPSSSRSGAKDSRQHLFDEEHERGEWAGEGPKLFELGNSVNQKDWQSLLDGFFPGGTEKLVNNAGDPIRQACWPFCIQAPKSFSTFVAASDPEFRSIAMDCHKAGEALAIRYLEEAAGNTRRGEGGKGSEKAALFWALFRHYESQSLDPHIHTHAFLINACIRQDGSTGTIKSIDFYRELRTANALFEAELAAQLTKRLGLNVIPLEKGGFKIEGVPEELCREFSKRSVAIAEELQSKNVQGPIARSHAANNTRPDKEIRSKEVLFSQWQETCRKFGFGEAEARRLVGQEMGHQAQKEDFGKVLSDAIGAKKGPAPTKKEKIELGRKLAIEHKVGGQEFKSALAPHLPEKPFIRIEWQQVFKKAPYWSPAKLVKAPVIVIGNQDRRRWGNILFEKKGALGHFRVQERFLVPRAPRWSPLNGIKFPALRYGKMRVREKEQWGKTQWKQDLKIGELRIQQRRVFPRALPWNPAKNLTIPVPRFVGRKAKQPTSEKPKQNSQQQTH